MVPPTILVPLDGSTFAECALPTAIEVSENLRGVIGLVCVSPKRQRRRLRGATGSGEEQDNVESEPYDYLKATAKRVEAASSVPVFRDVLTGSAAKELVRYAKLHHPELIVMSTHGRGPLSRAWLGSVADCLVRHASMPVLLVRPEDGVNADLTDRRGFGNVLIALDGSTQAEEGIRWAKTVGGKEPTYTLVRVARNSVPAWTVDTMFVPAYVDVSDYTSYSEAAHAEAAEYLCGVERLVNNGKHSATSVVVDGVAPAVGILETAKRKEADLIAITTHGRGGLPRLILGSVADKVVRASHLPVLVVRPG